jgi:hypothetical protein
VRIGRMLDKGGVLPQSFKTISGHHRVKDIIDVLGNASQLEIMAELMAASSESILNSIYSLS